jgi:Subtilase family
VRTIISLLLVATLSGCWFVKPEPPSRVSPDLTTVFKNPDVYLAGEDYIPNQYLVFVNRPASQGVPKELEGRIVAAGFKAVTSYPLPGAVNVVDGTPLAKPNVCGKLLVLVEAGKPINAQDAASLDGVLAQGLTDEYTVNPNAGGDANTQAVQPAGIGQAWLRYLNASQVSPVTNMKVAVLDTGVTVPPSQTGAPYMTLSNPLNTIDGSSNVNDDFQFDVNQVVTTRGHGTGVASVVAVQGLGTAPGATIVPIKFADLNGFGTGLSMIQGLCYAVSNDVRARVLNLSFGRLLPSSLAKGAVQDVINAGAVAIASAGNTRNTGFYTDKRCGLPNYPAAYSTGPDTNDGLIAVGGVKLKADSTPATGKPCDDAQQAKLEAASVGVAPGYFSTLGKYVDIAAPGVGVAGLSTDPQNLAYTDFEGTSFAAPFVAGAAAQILFKNPKLSPADVERILKTSVYPSTEYGCPPEACGAGFLNVGLALKNTP